MEIAARIRTEAERCVACGLCLPLCPTYRLTQNEAESPRGRIALARALALDELQPTEALTAHLDRCLTCRACEHGCPSGVAYGSLIDDVRALLVTRRAPTTARQWRPRLVRRLLESQSLSRALLRARLLAVAQRTGQLRLLRASGVTRLLGMSGATDGIGKVSPAGAWPSVSPARGTRRGTVALFLGCAGNVIDRATIAAALRVLTHIGYDVHVPQGQRCCGAMAAHAGDPEAASALAHHNARAFSGREFDHIVSLVSGCTAHLVDPQHAADVTTIATRTIDIVTLLAKEDWQRWLPNDGVPMRVAVHVPCSFSHVLRRDQDIFRVLEQVPGLAPLTLAENHLCCGGAGLYPLTEPTMALRLRDSKVAHLQNLAPDVVVTSSLGCALQLRAGIRAAGLGIEVLHPVRLLAQRIEPRAASSAG